MSAATYDAMALPELALPLQQLDVKGKGVMGVYSVCAFTADTARVLALLQAPASPSQASSSSSGHSPLCLSPLVSPAIVQRSRPWLSLGDVGSPGAGWGGGFRRHSLDRSHRTSAQSDGGVFRRSVSEPVALGDVMRARPPPRAWDAVAPERAWASAAAQAAERLVTPKFVGARGAAVCLLFCMLVAASTPSAALAQGAPLLLRLAALLAAAHIAITLLALLHPRAGRAGLPAGPPRESAADVMASLHAALARAGTEADILRAGCDAAMALLPDVLACALGVFAEGADGAVVSRLECGGDAAAQRALAAALPAGVSSQEHSGDSSVARACATDAGAEPIDSRRVLGGMGACSDWASALQAGLRSKRAVTLKLSAGLVTVGFMQLHFGINAPADAADAAALLALSEAISGAIFVRRAFAINRDASDASALPHAPEERQHMPTIEDADAEAEAAAFVDDDEMLEALDASAAADAKQLLTWDLDAWALPDAEVARLMVAMLHSAGLLRRFALRPATVFKFLECVAANYNNNPFHCWRHSCMVMHACWLFLADPAVRGLLEDMDCLALLLSAICHDLDHPGTTNAFQVRVPRSLCACVFACSQCWRCSRAICARAVG